MEEHLDNESLRDSITSIMYGADWKKQKIANAFKPDVEAAMHLIEQDRERAIQQYHNEITANETKVWITKEDFDNRIDKAVMEAVLNVINIWNVCGDDETFNGLLVKDYPWLTQERSEHHE